MLEETQVNLGNGGGIQIFTHVFTHTWMNSIKAFCTCSRSEIGLDTESIAGNKTQDACLTKFTICLKVG